MDINIQDNPPDDIPRIRKKYRWASLISLGMTFAALCVGAASVLYATGYDTILQYCSFAGFVAAGFVFVYFSEKLMAYRRLGIQQKKELLSLAEEYPDIAEYCRKVSAQGRYIVVKEFDSMLTYKDKIQGTGPAHKPGY